MWERLDPELVEPLKGLLEATGGGLDFNDVPATRAMLDGLVAAVAAEAPPIEGVSIEDCKVPGLDGAHEVPIRIYRPDSARALLPVSLWLHGGGYALGGIELDDLFCRQFAKDTNCALVAVAYRLAPEHPYPAALEDCYAVLGWIASHAESLGLDAARVGVAGASAGAGLASGTALMARDRGELDVRFQMLIYPGVDDTNILPASATRPDTLFWTRENNRLAWAMYLGELAGTDDVPGYAAALRAEDLSGLPPTWLAVGSIDLYMAEDLEFARRLAAAGVATELHVYPGAFHAFDVFAPMAAVAQRCIAERNAALVRGLDASREA